jgi:multiple sugar transport system substrate-binding protein
MMNGGTYERMTRQALLRRATVTATVTATAVLLAACSQAAAPATPAATTPTQAAAVATSPAVAAPASTGATTATLGYRSGDQKYMENRVAAFALENTKIKIELQPTPGSNTEYYPKLSSAFAAGSAPDAFWVSTGFGLHHAYAYQGQLLNVEDYVKRDNLDLSQWFPAAITTLRGVDAKLHALPWGMHPDEIGLYYNADMFKSAGVAPIDNDKETIDTLTEKTKKLTKTTGTHTDVWGILTLVGAFSTGLISFVRDYGGDFYTTPEGKVPGMDSKEAMQALQWLYDLRMTYKSNPRLSELDPSGAEEAFIGGRVAMFNSLCSEMSVKLKIGTKFQLAVGLIPKGPTGVRGSMAHVDTISGYSKGKHQDEAFEIVKFLTNKESGVQLAVINSFFGARQDVWDDPRPAQAWGADLVDVWKAAMPSTMPLAEPWNFRLTDLETAINNTLAPLWNGDSTVAQIVPKLQTAMKAVLDQPR